MINIYSKSDIQTLKEGGSILARILNTLAEKTVEGISTAELDEEAKLLCEKYDAVPAFLNYTPPGSHKPFPGALCISINDEVVHGIPNKKERILKKGDVVILDMGLLYKGLYTDTAITVIVGGNEANPVGAKMIEVAERALAAAIDNIKPGVRTGSVGHVIERAVKDNSKFTLPSEFGGHGIGYGIHEDPFMPNFSSKGEGPILREGMVLAIEPILTQKSPRIKLLRDGYTYATVDGGLSVHVEHTIVVTKNGCEVLTY